MRSLFLFLILAANALAGSSPYEAFSRVSFGSNGAYLVQEPKIGSKTARAILVYAHGGGGQELSSVSFALSFSSSSGIVLISNQS